MTKLLLLNGPNLNLLGQREPSVYGKYSLEAIVEQCQQFAVTCDFTIRHQQSNAEHELIDAIQTCIDDDIAGIIFNPAGFTHTSVALRDSLLAVEIPFVEVHLSQPLQREHFRHHSYFSDIAIGTVAGFGIDSYLLGLQAMVNYLDGTGNSR